MTDQCKTDFRREKNYESMYENKPGFKYANRPDMPIGEKIRLLVRDIQWILINDKPTKVSGDPTINAVATSLTWPEKSYLANAQFDMDAVARLSEELIFAIGRAKSLAFDLPIDKLPKWK